MQNDKLSLIKQLKKIIPFVFKYSPYYKVPNKKKNVKLNWGQQQITLIKFSFSLLLHSTTYITKPRPDPQRWQISYQVQI